jgi:hypothetical protein
MVSVLASSSVDLGSTTGRVLPKIIKLVFVASLLSMQALTSKSKNWLARNQNNVSKWSDMSNSRLLFQ